MKKVLTLVVFPVIIIVLAVLIYVSISKPVKFNNEKAAREAVAIQQLKDIRTLQVTFKSANNRYAPSMDSLIDFYNNGKITVMLQIGSTDDSVAVAHTEQVKKAHRKISEKELYEMYKAGDTKLIVSLPMEVAVKDTLFNDRPDFKAENLRYIPFADGDTVIMSSVIKTVSGVNVPLFEAKIPYGKRPAPKQDFRGLLYGMNEQLIINLNAEREDTGRYPGLMVGSVEQANNNAGNWE